jgi:hypothetical protein
MEKIRETFSALEQLKGQLNGIINSEILKTERMLHNLMIDSVNIEKNELSENEARLRHLAEDVVSIEKKEFSLMKVFGVENYELAHSSFLAWLLDPLGDHGLGSQFVEKFICKVASKTKKVDLTGIDFRNLCVDREVSGDESRLDIRVRDQLASFVCVIENKILAKEGTDQTNRLYRDYHDVFSKELFVFLTLDEKVKPINRNFTPITYREVLSILRSLSQDSINPDTRFLIRHYVNTLERLIMSENFEGFSERTKLYYRYQKYIDEVRKAFDRDRQLLLSTLEEEVKRRQWWNDKFWGMDRTGGDITIWKNSWYLSEHQGVYIELYLHKSQPAFSLYVYGEPSEFSTKFGPVFKGLLDKEHTDRVTDAYTKTFMRGVSRFIESEIPLSFSEKDQVQRILSSLDEMVQIFEKTIDRSIEEFRKSSPRV